MSRSPFPFGAYTSTLEAFSCCGTPVVTLPSAQTKMLTAHAVYAELGISGLVARNTQEYVDIAVKVATDREWRGTLVDKIKNGSARLFRDTESVKEWEQFLAAAHRQAQYHARDEAGDEAVFTPSSAGSRAMLYLLLGLAVVVAGAMVKCRHRRQ